MKILFNALTLFFLLLHLEGYSQIFSDNSVTAPPQTANEFMGQLHHNVNLQTGALNFSLPLLSLKVDNGLEIPINLTYGGNGIRFDQKTGEVGLGWGVTSNFKVNRTIYGRPDEHYPRADEQTLSNLYFSTDNEWRDILLTQFTVGLSSNGGLALKSGLQTLDGEYDIFDYNTPSVSGSFIIENPAIKAISNSESPLMKIDYSVDTTNGINSINIKDTKGNSFLAGFDESSNTFLSESIPRYGKQASYSWPITRIVSPNGRSATITYTHEDVFEQSIGQLGMSIHETVGSVTGYPTFYSTSSIEGDGSVPNRKSYLTSSIKSQYGEIIITRQAFSYLISDITLYDQDQHPVTKIVFNRSVIQSKVMLSSISIYKGSSQVPQVYTFDYYAANPTFSPDIWGNIKASATSTKGFPQELVNEEYYQLNELTMVLESHDLQSLPDQDINFTDRSPGGIPNAFSLKQVGLPTGGYISYEYEANFFRNAAGQTRQGPGIRISSISKYDATTTGGESKTYKYGVNEDGIGSIPIEVDKRQFGLDQIIVQVGPDYALGRPLYGSRTRLFSNDPISDGDPFFTTYNYVSYPVVTERSGPGATRYYFKEGSNMTWYLNTGQNSAVGSPMMNGNPLPTDYRPGFLYDYNFAYKPLILKTEIIDANNQVVRKDTFSYELVGHKVFLQMKIKPYAIFRDGAFSPEFNHTYTGFTSIYDYGLSNIDFGYWNLVQRETIEQRDGLPISNKSEYTYNTDQQIRKETHYLSDQSKKEIQYSYPNDFPGIMDGDDVSWSVYEMQNSNQLDNWVEQRTYMIKNVGGVEVPTLVNAQFQGAYPGTDHIWQTYNYFKKASDPAFTPAGTGNSLVLIDSKYKKQIAEVLMVDNAGNVLEVSDQNGIITTYIWGYKNNYLVAKVVGADYYAVTNQLDLELVKNGNELQMKQQLAQMRSALAASSAKIYTYTHKPLVGITSETDPRGVITFYEYDAEDRLSCIRDQNNNIIKRINYKYNGQPEPAL